MSRTKETQYQRQYIQQKESVLLVQVTIGRHAQAQIEEMISLVESAGGAVSAVIRQQRKSPDPSFFIGKGKAGEIKLMTEELGLETIVFDHNLSPGQVSKLEDVTQCKVIDRTELILAIFACQARTREAKLQIELAQLNYALPRLSGMWHHFSRLGAGIGTRGPGETQLEIDRRRARTRIRHIERRLESIENQIKVRTSRRKWMFKVTLVGYTNAGKSTLLNTLSGADAHTEDRLFATLDTTSRRLKLPRGGGTVLLSDTVGFIERLPETLIASFRTTLGVVRDADLLLMVVDRSDQYREQKIDSVRKTLESIEAGSIPVLVVWNKCDLVTETISNTSGVAVSALENDGMENLLQRISQLRDASLDWFRLTLDNPGEDVVSWLHRNCLVKKFMRTGENIEMIGAIARGSGAVRKYLSNGEIDFRLAPWPSSGDDAQSIERAGETSDG